MPHPSRLLRLSIGLAVAAAGVLSIALSGAPGGAQAVPLAQGLLPTVPCTSTSTLFATNLSSDQEVPPSGTGQTGTAVSEAVAIAARAVPTSSASTRSRIFCSQLRGSWVSLGALFMGGTAILRHSAR